jgi:phosphoribosyl 1,2-cyclic phosphate phosphodiesterase
MITVPGGKNIVFDTTPDFRAQMLREKVSRLEAVIYTHTHSDHIHGFDDLRAFYFYSKKPVPCYIHSSHVDELRTRFSYAFRQDGYHGTKPQVQLKEFGSRPFKIAGLKFEPALAPHGDQQTVVFRVGSFAYATDFKSLDRRIIKKWRGTIHTMVASGLKFGEHATHSTIEETVALFADLGVKQGILTHMGHEVDSVKHVSRLPRGVVFAYDGMKISLI